MHMETEDLLLHIGGRTKASPENILLLKADVNYTQVYFNDGSSFLSSINLGVFEKRLQESGQFFRPNRSYIVNLSFVSEFEQFSNTIKLRNEEVISLSRRRVKQFYHFSNPKKDLSW